MQAAAASSSRPGRKWRRPAAKKADAADGGWRWSTLGMLAVAITATAALVAATATAAATRPSVLKFAREMAVEGGARDAPGRAAGAAPAAAPRRPGSSKPAVSGERAGDPVPGCPRGTYMSEDRRARAEAALAEHFERYVRAPAEGRRLSRSASRV